LAKLNTPHIFFSREVSISGKALCIKTVSALRREKVAALKGQLESQQNVFWKQSSASSSASWAG